MHAPALRRQPSTLSRMLSSTRSARTGRGLGDVVSGVVHGVSVVVHDASDVAHDVGHAVGDVLSGKFSKVPDDIVKTGLDVVKTGKDALDVVHGNHDSGGSGSGSGDQNPSGGGLGGTHPRPPADPGLGGGEDPAPQPSRPDSSQAPASTTPPASSTSPSENTAPASSTASNTVPGAANVASDPSYDPPTESMNPPAKTGAGREDGRSTYGMQLWSISSATQSLTTMDTLPSNGVAASAAAHRKGFPLAAAAALGAVLGVLVVSALFWAVWLYLRKRRRAFHAVYLPPKRMLSVMSARTVSTVPLFISASEAGVKDDSKNPFRHPLDEDEGDPFDAASLWRSSTTRSASTLSV